MGAHCARTCTPPACTCQAEHGEDNPDDASLNPVFTGDAALSPLEGFRTSWASSAATSFLRKTRSLSESLHSSIRATAKDEDVSADGSSILDTGTEESSEPNVYLRQKSHDQTCNGVRVERVYECYDPMAQRWQTLEVTEQDRVIHRRPRGRDSFHSRESVGGSSCSSDDGISIASSSLGSVGSKQSTSPSSPTPLAAEICARWGVVIGKLLHYRVLALTTLSNKVIVRKRTEKGSKGGFWRRVETRANKVVGQARELMKRVASQPDCFDGDWGHGSSILSFLFTSEYLDTLMILAGATTKLVSVQPILAETAAPCRVFGDIHGQLRDVLLMFHAFGGIPCDRNPTSFVFNGDFVDRGAHQLEVIGLLFALKISFPDKIWLVRGNHEDRGMNEKYGFKNTCLTKLGSEFGLKTFDLCQFAFNQLPLACLVSERVLCVHGGIGDGRWDLDKLRSLKRPITDKLLMTRPFSWVYNILWSDPIEDDVGDAGVVFGVHESPRAGAGVIFGWDVTKTFCARNGLGLVVRSHQSKRDGLGFDVMHDNMLVRVFSARDYEGGGNDAAVLLISSVDDAGSTALHVRPQVVASFAKTSAALRNSGSED